MAAFAGHPYQAVFAIAMTTGMRPSEYLALTWADLDLVRGLVNVSKTLVWHKGGWSFEEPKRKRSHRTVKLQNWVTALLVSLDTSARSAGASRTDLVFTATRRGPIRETWFVHRYFKPIVAAAALPNIRLYDLRHTAATLALAAGVSPKIVSEQLGHASVAFTLEVYTHVLPHMQDSAASQVEALLLAA